LETTQDEGTSGNEDLDLDQQGSEGNESEDILDLDSVERFRYGGVEYTPKELQNAMLRQSDYTRKTQALAEERKYAENFAADAARVMEDPSLLSKFKEIYPDKYVQALMPYVKQSESQTQSQGNLPPEIMEKLNKYDQFMSQMEQKEFETQVQQNEAKIDQAISKYSDKYPLADEQTVLSYASSYADKYGNLNDKVWEQIFKTVHSKVEGYVNQRKGETFNQQRSANRKGRDIAPGGGIPAQAPEKVPLNKVKDLWIKDLEGR